METSIKLLDEECAKRNLYWSIGASSYGYNCRVWAKKPMRNGKRFVKIFVGDSITNIISECLKEVKILQ